MKKKFIYCLMSCAIATGVILPISTPQAKASDYLGGGYTEERIVLGTTYISREDVKAMAAYMRGSQAIGWSALSRAAQRIAGMGFFVTAAGLSADAQVRKEVLYAADNNMRVKATITDSKAHTSYSTHVEYKAVY